MALCGSYPWQVNFFCVEIVVVNDIATAAYWVLLAQVVLSVELTVLLVVATRFKSKGDGQE
jgi:hypothetical protein